MAVARDQAARILRVEPDKAEADGLRDAVVVAAEQLRAQLTEDAVARRQENLKENPKDNPAPAEQPAPVIDDKPAPEKPAAAPAVTANPAAPKSGKRKFVLMGVGALLALAAASYGVHYLLVGRFYVSTDDAYVRANNTTLGARVSGHVASILPGDNTLVRAGDVIFKIDDGDYRIAVDAARTKIATQEATIERIGRQIAALQSAVEQASAQLVSAQAGQKRADLDFDRQEALNNKGFASRATYEVSEAARDQGKAAVNSAQAAYDTATANVEVTKAQQAGQGRARPRVHDRPRPGRRHLLQPPGLGRRLHRGRTAARQRGAARRRLYRRQLQGNPAQAYPSRPAGDDLGRCLWPSQVRRRGRQHLAGGGLGVHAATA
jgi:membrane fusion protein (multidrug efflux system)